MLQVMAAAIPPSDSNVCFAELIVRLDSLLTLRDNQEGEEATEQFDEKEKENLEDSKKELEVDIKRKLTELHLRLKNGGSIYDRAGGPGGPGDDDDEDEAVEDSQGPSSATEGVSGSVDCVGCSSAEDENEVCPSPIQPNNGGWISNLQIVQIIHMLIICADFSHNILTISPFSARYFMTFIITFYNMVYKKHLKIPHMLVSKFSINSLMIVAYLFLNFLIVLNKLFLIDKQFIGP